MRVCVLTCVSSELCPAQLVVCVAAADHGEGWLCSLIDRPTHPPTDKPILVWGSRVDDDVAQRWQAKKLMGHCMCAETSRMRKTACEREEVNIGWV